MTLSIETSKPKSEAEMINEERQHAVAAFHLQESVRLLRQEVCRKLRLEAKKAFMGNPEAGSPEAKLANHVQKHVALKRMIGGNPERFKENVRVDIDREGFQDLSEDVIIHVDEFSVDGILRHVYRAEDALFPPEDKEAELERRIERLERKEEWS